MTKNDHFGQILRISNVHYSAHRSKFKKQKNNVFYFLHRHKIPATRNFLCLTVSKFTHRSNSQNFKISNVHYSAHRSKFKKQIINVFYFLHRDKIPATRNFLCLTVSEIQIFHDVKFLKGWYRFGRAEREVIKFCDFRWVHSHWLRVDLMCHRRSLQTCKFLVFSV